MQRIYPLALALALLARPSLAIDQTYFGDAGPGPMGTCCIWVDTASPAGLTECPSAMLAEHPTCRVISDAEFWHWLRASHEALLDKTRHQ